MHGFGVCVQGLVCEVEAVFVHRRGANVGLEVGEAVCHPGGNPGANLKSISHRCYLFEVAFVWELTK